MLACFSRKQFFFHFNTFLHWCPNVLYQSDKCLCNISVRRTVCFRHQKHVSWDFLTPRETPTSASPLWFASGTVSFCSSEEKGPRGTFPHPLFHQFWIQSSINLYKTVSKRLWLTSALSQCLFTFCASVEQLAKSNKLWVKIQAFWGFFWGGGGHLCLCSYLFACFYLVCSCAMFCVGSFSRHYSEILTLKIKY